MMYVGPISEASLTALTTNSVTATIVTLRLAN
jgi:hypothetical protein